ncbi:MAG: AsmA family protein, partial [Myxococcota bacterium]
MPSSSGSQSSPGSEAIESPPPPSAASGGAAAPRPRRRVRRVVLWLLAGLFVLIVVAIGLVLLVLGNLDNRTVAGWIKTTAADSFALGVDYDELSVSPFSGLSAGQLEIASPAPYAEHAPKLLQVGSLDIDWDFLPLLSGEPHIERFELRGLTFTVVVDENGETSLTKLVEGFGEPEEPEPDEPIVPLSQTLQELLPALSLGSLSITQVRVEVVELSGGAVARRSTLGDICLRSRAQVAPGALDAELDIEPCDKDRGIALVVTESGDSGDSGASRREMRIGLSGALRTPSPQSVELTLTGDLLAQDLLPEVAASGPIIRATLSAAFEPDSEQTRVAIDRFELLGGVMTTELAAVLRDGPEGAIVPWVERLSGQVDGDRALAVVPTLVDGISVENTALSYEVSDLAIGSDDALIERGQAKIELQSSSAAVAAAGMNVHDASLTAELTFDQPSRGRLSSRLQVGALVVDQPGEPAVEQSGEQTPGPDSAEDSAEPAAPLRVAVSDLSFEIDGSEMAIN